MLNFIPFLSSNFGRYASLSDTSMNDLNGINENGQTKQNSIINNTSPPMSSPITPLPMTKTSLEQSEVSQNIIKENIAPLPHSQNGPGPIRRPITLPCPLNAKSPATLDLIDNTQSPNTPDILHQLDRILDRQISRQVSTANDVNPTSSSTMPNDLSTPNISWTPIQSPEWPLQYDTSWSATNNSNPTVRLTTQTRNPFVQQQISQEESLVWPSILEKPMRRWTLPEPQSQCISELNEPFPSANAADNSWLQFLPVLDSSSTDHITSNEKKIETNNSLWNAIDSNKTQQDLPTSWWLKTSSDGNNHDNNQSRWDFAR